MGTALLLCVLLILTRVLLKGVLDTKGSNVSFYISLIKIQSLTVSFSSAKKLKRMVKEIHETSSVSSVKEGTILSVVPEWFSTFRPSVSSFADSLQKIT